MRKVSCPLFEVTGGVVSFGSQAYDIPNTGKSAMKVLSQLSVNMTSVHAAGGVEMMKAAREGLGTQAKLIAVTQHITSGKPDAGFSKYQTSLQESVIHYAKEDS